MTEITVADLQTIGDIADALTEQSDGLGATEAVILLDAALAAQARLKVAIDMLEAQALRSIEQPIVVGHTVYAKRRVYKKRPDQETIRRLVADQAARPDPNGELPPVHEAAQAAVGLMAGMYVSPSTVPKVGGVQALGVGINDVCRREHTGFEISRTDLEEKETND